MLFGKYLGSENSEEATLIVMRLSADYLGFNYIDGITSYRSTVAVMHDSQVIHWVIKSD